MVKSPTDSMARFKFPPKPSFRSALFCDFLQGEFDWDKKLQGFILSSYFFGYLSTQALGGWLGGRYGAKHVAGCGLFLSAAATVLTPAAARITPYLVIALRVIVGAASVCLI
jgi:ACS family sodium-dependent inorganic phosphate cotransporter-like MFS transporter 5